MSNIGDVGDDVCVQRAGAARDARGGRGHYALLLHGLCAAVHDGERVRAADAEYPRPVWHDCGEQAVRGAGGHRAGQYAAADLTTQAAYDMVGKTSPLRRTGSYASLPRNSALKMAALIGRNLWSLIRGNNGE